MRSGKKIKKEELKNVEARKIAERKKVGRKN